ncbi:MAG: response regulator [Planctomycetota bacterium]|jgi:two-component system alkaline phosphatase synthesis response regulator PhoP
MPDAKKILVVDDEPHILRSLGFVLQRAGYEVLEARGGAEALRLIAQERPDLIFLDIMLPELDGYEVCRRVKSDDELAATYVIMLTARGQLADREESLTAGADEYIVARVQEALAQTR